MFFFLVKLTSQKLPQLDTSRINVLLFTAHAMWGEMLQITLTSTKDNINVTTMDVEEDNLQAALNAALKTRYDLILVASPSFGGGDLFFVRALRNAGCHTPTLILSSFYAVPHLQDLRKAEVQGIISTKAKTIELKEAILEIINGQHDTLKQQYTRAVRNLIHQPKQHNLTAHELEIINLLAVGLSDKEIGELLSITEKTVSNQMRTICSKMGINRRSGVIGAAFRQGFITPYSVQTAQKFSEE